MAQKKLRGLSPNKGLNNDHAKKVAKKEADAHVIRGVALLDKHQFEDAKQLFDNALDIFPKHADSLYNLGVLSLEILENRTCDNMVSEDEICTAFSYFDQIISFDTSQRGETTALAHRAKANAIAQYADVFSDRSRWLELGQKHFERCLQILQVSHGIDSYYLEFAQLLRLMLSDSIVSVKKDLNVAMELRGYSCLWDSSICAAIQTRVCAIYDRISGTLNNSLQSAMSSGIDSEVVSFHAEVAVEYWDFLLDPIVIGTWYAPNNVLLSSPISLEIQQLFDETQAICVAISSLLDGEPEMQVIVVELVQRLCLFKSISGELELSLALLERYVSHVYSVLLKIVNTSTLEDVRRDEVIAATGDSFGFFTLANLHPRLLEGISVEARTSLNQCIAILSSAGVNPAQNIIPSGQDKSPSQLLLFLAILCYKYALGHCSDEDRKADTSQFLYEVSYNLSCVCWRIGDKSGCFAALHACLGHRLEFEARIMSPSPARLPKAQESTLQSAEEKTIQTRRQLHEEINQDADLNGIQSEDWYINHFVR